MIFAVIGIFFVMIIAGFPIAFALGLVPTAFILYYGLAPDTVLIQKMFGGLDSFPVLAIPLFILAGELMSCTGMSTKLVDFANMIVRRISGGFGMATVISSTLFGGVSGSANADTAAIGAITVPGLINSGYSRGFSTSLQAASGTIGTLIPPSIMFIMYGVVSNTSVAKLFMGGIIPGILMCLAFCIICYVYAKTYGKDSIKPYETGQGKTKRQLIVGALPALGLPIIIVGGIRFGVVTPTEGAAVAVLYAILVGVFGYRTLNLTKLKDAIMDTAVTSATVLMILANAYILSWLLTTENLPGIISGFLEEYNASPILLLLFVNIILLIVGTFLEGIAAVILLVPVLLPIAMAAGISPIGFGLIIVVNLSIGMYTPPVGVTLFVSCGISKAKMTECKSVLAFIGAAIAVLAIVTIFNGQIVNFVDMLFGE